MEPTTFDIIPLLVTFSVTIAAVIVAAIGGGLATGFLPKLAAHIGVSVYSKFVKK